MKTFEEFVKELDPTFFEGEDKEDGASSRSTGPF